MRSSSPKWVTFWVHRRSRAEISSIPIVPESDCTLIIIFFVLIFVRNVIHGIAVLFSVCEACSVSSKGVILATRSQGGLARVCQFLSLLKVSLSTFPNTVM